MNAQRRKEISKAAKELAALNASVEAVKEAEQNILDDMPDNMRNGEQGEAMQQGIEALDDALSLMDEALGTLADIGDADIAEKQEKAFEIGTKEWEKERRSRIRKQQRAMQFLTSKGFVVVEVDGEKHNDYVNCVKPKPVKINTTWMRKGNARAKTVKARATAIQQAVYAAYAKYPMPK